MLQVTVVISGAVLLSIEVLGSRLLAPYFGNSIHVWGSVIGVFLAALSIGYAVGGRIADRQPSAPLFFGLVLAAGLLTLCIPFLAPSVLEYLGESRLSAEVCALLGAVVLFMIPMTVMGMISPFAVRLQARTVNSIGRTAGSLYALGTVGSLAGTFGTAFFLIGYAGVRASIMSMGLTLVALAAVGWFSQRIWSAPAVCLLTVIPFGVSQLPLGPITAIPDAVYAKDSAYHLITVTDVNSVRFLHLDSFPQSAVDRDHPEESVLPYSNYLQLPLVLVPEARHATIIGLGGGTVATRYIADRPSLVVEVAEIDPQVINAAETYFGVRATERLRIYARDGRRHLNETSNPQDIIVTDACATDVFPFHLATREFFSLAHSRLSPGGVFAANMIGALDGPDSRAFRAIYKTLSAVFRTVYVFPVDGGRKPRGSLRNIVLIGTDANRLTSKELFLEAHDLVFARVLSGDKLLEAAASLDEAEVQTGDVPLLTDDFAPLEKLAGARKPCRICQR